VNWINKKLFVKPEDFFKALSKAGYSKIRDIPDMEWRKTPFHIIIKKVKTGSGGMTISLHMDFPVSIAKHGTVASDKRLEKELRRILSIYGVIRARINDSK